MCKFSFLPFPQFNPSIKVWIFVTDYKHVFKGQCPYIYCRSHSDSLYFSPSQMGYLSACMQCRTKEGSLNKTPLFPVDYRREGKPCASCKLTCMSLHRARESFLGPMWQCWANHVTPSAGTGEKESQSPTDPYLEVPGISPLLPKHKESSTGARKSEYMLVGIGGRQKQGSLYMDKSKVHSNVNYKAAKR